MGFSATPENAAKELDVMLNIADKLDVLLDKDKLADLVKTINSMSVAEKIQLQAQRAEAEEAKTNIAEYRQLIENNRKQKDALDAYKKSLDDDKEKQDVDFLNAKTELESKKTANDAALAKIDEGNKSLDEREKSIAERERAYLVDKQQLQVDIENQRRAEADLASRKQEVAAKEAALKASADELKRITGGL